MERAQASRPPRASHRLLAGCRSPAVGHFLLLWECSQQLLLPSAPVEIGQLKADSWDYMQPPRGLQHSTTPTARIAGLWMASWCPGMGEAMLAYLSTAKKTWRIRPRWLPEAN